MGMTKRNKPYTTEEFKERAKEVHGDRYDYSLSSYISSKHKTTIICHIHGTFEQNVKDHLQGNGCIKCKYINVKTRKTNEDFILDAKLIHSDRYDYSQIKYINNSTNINIICHIHGTFEQNPSHHLNGSGCKKCFYETSLHIKPQSLNEFITKANIMHNNKYDYSSVLYKNSLSKVDIICTKHGVFSQLPNIHVFGVGCPNCCISKNEEIIKKFLLLHNIPFHSQHKFSDCKNKRSLPFDFYLPEHNICIEYDGEFHYKPFKSNDIISLSQVQTNDNIKTIYCINRGIKLIRISYHEKVNIESILSLAIL